MGQIDPAVPSADTVIAEILKRAGLEPLPPRADTHAAEPRRAPSPWMADCIAAIG